jgi:hypothetical protein
MIVESIGGISFSDAFLMMQIISMVVGAQLLILYCLRGRYILLILFIFIIGNMFFFVYLAGAVSKYDFFLMIFPLIVLVIIAYKMSFSYVFLTWLALMIVPLLNVEYDKNRLNNDNEKIKILEGNYNKSIYFFGIDAMTSSSAYKMMFDINGSPATSWMKENGFRNVDLISPASSTLETWASWLQARKITHPRNTIGLLNGSRKSLVYDSLRGAGYEIHAAFDSDYYGTDAGKIDSFYPNFQRSSICTYIDRRWAYYACDLINIFKTGNDYFLYDKFDVVMKNIRFKKDKPIFFASHIFFPGHPIGAYDPAKTEDVKNFKKYYVESQIKLKNYIKDLTENILKNDPGAIIVFVGDHGPLMHGDSIQKNSIDNFGVQINGERYLRMDKYDILFAAYNFNECNLDYAKPENLILNVIQCATG